MAVQEHSVGPFYFAGQATNVRRVPVHRVGIVQMEEPWRRGRAVVLPVWPFFAMVLGFWTKTIYDEIEEDFKDDMWINPQRLGESPDVIRTWWDGSEREESVS